MVRDWVIDGFKLVVVFSALLMVVPVLAYAERRVCALIQDRLGPNRVGPFGLLQPFADALKLLFKEDLIPEHADRFLFVLAPMLALGTPVLLFAVVPFGNAITLTAGGVRAAAVGIGAGGVAAAVVLAGLGIWIRRRKPKAAWLFPPLVAAAPLAVIGGAAAAFGLSILARTIPPEGLRVALQVSDLPAGILFVLAAGSLGVYGIALGGWSSNNKFALLGALRASAQLISYEITLVLAILAVVMSTSDAGGVGTVRMSQIVGRQAEAIAILGIPFPGWYAFRQPLAFLLFLIAAFAETNRLPFDMPECEAELVAGYHTEYSSMKFSMFFMGEYVAITSMSALAVTLFLGGWHVPGLDPKDASLLSGLVSVAAFAAKTGAILFLYLWVRWSIPRFRYDQIMRIGWKVLVPAAVLNVLATAALAQW